MTTIVDGSNGVSFPAGATQGTGAGPAFYAYRTAAQTGISNTTFTKIQFNTKLFDTNTNYDAVTNYRFTPTVAGYYQLNASVSFEGSSSMARFLIGVYKNGTETSRGTDVISTGNESSVATILYFNGSTDYAEIYGYVSGSGIQTSANSYTIYFNGCLVRGA